MIAFLLSWCLAFPAQMGPTPDVYFMSGDFAGRTDGARIWASAPISATAVYTDTADVATISLHDSLGFRDRDGAFQSQSAAPYTVYVCAADARPRVLYVPMFQT